MSSISQGLVDGEGNDRIIMYLKKERVRLRPVRESDCKLLWKWANEPEVRAASFSSHYISWEEHTNWLQQKIKDPNCIHFIAVNGDEKPQGQIRFDIKDDGRATINVSIDKYFRSFGLGSIIIDKAVLNLFNNTMLNTVEANIKLDNLKSLKTFEKANFKLIAHKYINGNECMQYIRSKSVE